MGVKGLWQLLNPVARPVKIETMEGKRLAIDSSIWLYQFQATMRDKDGRGLVNAHILGFLRRINRLLFHGIKPVFVFDGGAPNLKRQTIAERKRKKTGASLNHTVVAKKLLAAQMRREAVKATKEAQERRAAKSAATAANDPRYADDEGDVIPDNAVFLEDLEGTSRPRLDPSEIRPTLVRAESSSKSQRDTSREPSPATKRKSFRNFDPYKLPDLPDGPLTARAKPGAQPDHRLATEEEMKYFINEAHLEDLDFDSPEFKALPTEVQYEFVGDMRVRSRQPNSQRLANMLKASTSAMDFSKAQIKGLSQRNSLTQQLLTVTDTIGKANITIPVRVAAERNREYVLVKKTEEQGGGWALGIRDQGTKAKPIKIDQSPQKEVRPSAKPRISSDGYLGKRRRSDDDDDEDDDEDFEMLPNGPIDADLREHRRQEMISAIAERYAPKLPAKPSLDMPIKAFGKSRTPGSKPLFRNAPVTTAHDEELALDLQRAERGDAIEDEQLARALEDSRKEYENQRQFSTPHIDSDGESMDEVVVLPSTAVTPLGSPIETDDHGDGEESEPNEARAPSAPAPAPEEDDDEFEEVKIPPSTSRSPIEVIEVNDTTGDEESSASLDFERRSPAAGPGPSTMAARQAHSGASSPVPRGLSHRRTPSPPESDPQSVVSEPSIRGPRPMLDHEAHAAKAEQLKASHAAKAQAFLNEQADIQRRLQREQEKAAQEALAAFLPPAPEPTADAAAVDTSEHHTKRGENTPVVQTELVANMSSSRQQQSASPPAARQPVALGRQPSLGDGDYSVYDSDAQSAHRDDDDDDDDDDDGDGDGSDAAEERDIEWSKSPTPAPRERTRNGDEPEVQAPLAEDDGGIDMIAEEDDYARFVAQIQNRDLDKVREEIDDEVRVLHAQQKVAMRDSEEITQAMILQTQELLRYYGIPYVTAPMEAEAQCAKLAELNLVDGIITDDSDVFLFGGKQCYKNIFNDAKYAECFLLSDLDREMSLTRERLITLAYLLGSDYTLGLPGVGPVVAMELMANFPGPKGLEDFKAWWLKVQSGRDTEEDTATKWRKSFKKRFETVIFLTADWPNPLVRDAYKYPEVDDSKEPFNWGFPDLTSLRSFLHRELSWSITKIDHEMGPIMQRLAQRGTGSLTKQGRLDPFFDISAGQGSYIPRQRTTANVSKRLLAVIKQYREAEARLKGEEPAGWGVMMANLDESDPKGKGAGQAKAKRTISAASDASKKRKRDSEQGLTKMDDSSSEDSDAKREAAKPKRKAAPKARGQASGRARARAAMIRSDKSTADDASVASSDSMRGRGTGRARDRGRGRGRGGKAAQAAIEIEDSD